MTVRSWLVAALVLCAPPVWCTEDFYDQARTAVQGERLTDAERLLRQHLQQQDGDAEGRFLFARVLAWQGKYGEALGEYDRLLVADPANSDYLLGKAQVEVWRGKPGDALPLLERARQQSADYEDVWRLQIDALRAAGEPAKAVQLQELAQARFPASRWDRAELVAPLPASTAPADEAPPQPYRSELELGFSRESLSNAYSDWRSTYLEGMHTFAERQSIYGTLRETQRFGLHDSEALGGAYYPLNNTWTALLEASLSGTHQVLPRYSLLGQLQKSLDNGWNLQAGIRHSEYTGLNADGVILGTERYWGNFHGGYSLYVARPDGGSSVSSQVLALDYYYGDRNSTGISLADGREVAGLGPLGILTTAVRAYVLHGRHWFSPEWALTYEAVYQEQGSLYARHGISLGLRRAF